MYPNLIKDLVHECTKPQKLLPILITKPINIWSLHRNYTMKQDNNKPGSVVTTSTSVLTSVSGTSSGSILMFVSMGTSELLTTRIK